jgi:competence protein ComGC
MVQAFLTGIPIVAIVRDIPEAFYLVLTFLIFILSMILLLLIFFPKMTMQRRYSKMPMSAQRKHLKQSVRNSSIGQNTNHSGRLQRESHDMMEAAKIAQEQYEARKRSRGIVDSNASSIDSGFGSSDPMIQSGLIIPDHKSGALGKSKPFTCNFKAGDLKAEDSGDISMSSVTGAGLTLSSSSASILAGLFTSLELETILRNNGIVIEDIGSLPASSDVDYGRDFLISRVAKMLAERAYQKYGIASESPQMKEPPRSIENIDEVGKHSQMESIVEEENSTNGNEFENRNSNTGISPLVEQAPWPSIAETTSSPRRHPDSEQTDETSDETLNGSVRAPKEEGIQANYSEAETSIVEA